MIHVDKPGLIFDCDQCGLCCRELTVEASTLDVARAPEIAERCKRMDGKGSLKNVADWCWSIACGETLPCPFDQNVEGRSICSIYPNRPNICVSFQAGSQQCIDARKDAGLEPLKSRIPKTDLELCKAVLLDYDGDYDA